MTVYEAMRRRTGAVGIYDDNAPVLEWELESYAEELERLYTELDGMFRERFISTAEAVGLREYEELFGPERSDWSVEKRREMLHLRMNLGEGDFTPEGIRKALESFGLSYVLSEFPDLNRLNIAATADYSDAEQGFILREVSKIIPAHIEFQLTFNTLTWDDIDAMNKTFSEIDAEDLSWAELDARKPADNN